MPNDIAKRAEKAGARHTRSEFQQIQQIHDTAVSLGAVCTHSDDAELLKRPKERTLYVSRTLLNAAPLIEWAKEQGFKTTLQPGDLHVTVAYSKKPLVWPAALHNKVIADDTVGREVRQFDGGATVLLFKSSLLNARWDHLRSIGASWGHDSYQPHITISWEAEDLDLSKVEPYKGPLILGPEVFKEIDEDWRSNVVEKGLQATVTKVDAELGIVFGWALISKVKGEDYYDTQNDHIPEGSMMKAAAEYMNGPRVAGNMHRPTGPFGDSVERIGTVVFAFPLTTDLAESMKIKTEKTGLLIGMHVDSPTILEKFRSGAYTGFSIGGKRIQDAIVL